MTDPLNVRRGSPEWFSWRGYTLTEDQALIVRRYLNDHWLADAVLNGFGAVSDAILATAMFEVLGIVSEKEYAR